MDGLVLYDGHHADERDIIHKNFLCVHDMNIRILEQSEQLMIVIIKLNMHKYVPVQQ